MNLPKAELDIEEAMKLWQTEHSEYAKEQLVLNNVGMVGIVLKSLNLNVFDEDLFATGLLGLVKAVNKFDFEKGFSFSAYATRVISNEILISFRKKRVSVSFSLDELKDIGNGEEVSYADIIPADANIEDDVVANTLVSQVLGNLPKRERKVIDLISFQGKDQKETADIIGISQAQVSRILKNARNKCKKEFGY